MDEVLVPGDMVGLAPWAGTTMSVDPGDAAPMALTQEDTCLVLRCLSRKTLRGRSTRALLLAPGPRLGWFPVEFLRCLSD